MKKFTTEEIIILLNQVMREEIRFSQMVEVINERVDQSEVSEFKDGDFVAGLGCVFILHKQIDKYSAQYHVLYAKTNRRLLYRYYKTYSQFGGIDKLRLATEAEKQLLLDALEKDGKQWNAEKLCIEDIPVRKFKKGDKVRIKHGVSSKTHYRSIIGFVEDMDDLIGKTMTVYRYIDDNNCVECEETEYAFLEDWLEPCEELKKGDLAIFWQFDKTQAVLRLFNSEQGGVFQIPTYVDNNGHWWSNAIKFESKEQFEKLIKGEI